MWNMSLQHACSALSWGPPLAQHRPSRPDPRGLNRASATAPRSHLGKRWTLFDVGNPKIEAPMVLGGPADGRGVWSQIVYLSATGWGQEGRRKRGCQDGAIGKLCPKLWKAIPKARGGRRSRISRSRPDPTDGLGTANAGSAAEQTMHPGPPEHPCGCRSIAFRQP